MWIIYAIGASMLWGLVYLLGEHIYQKISVATTLAILCAAGLFVALLVALQRGTLQKDFETIASSRGLFLLIVAETVAFVLAEFCIGLSVSNKNATLAGLVEISYPIFIALFAFLIFREETINLTTLAGATLIFSGIFVIYHFNH